MRFYFILLSIIAFHLNSATAKVFDLKVRGVILDSISQAPIENATVQILFEKQPYKTALSKYDGSFNIPVIENGQYELTISHVGYKTYTIPISINEGVNLNFTIKLQLDQIDLKEITVKANKPLISQKNGEITYQIEGGIWQNSGNALNVINRIPILKGRSGSAYLLFGSKVVFLLDGKPIESMGVTLDAVLSNFGSDEIDKIELLLSPPPSLARFGRPIVNIKTIKLKDNGSLFNLNHGYCRGINDRFNNGIKYSLKENNLLLNVAFLQSHITQLSKTSSIKEITPLRFNDIENIHSKSNLLDYKLAGEYSTVKLGTVNFSYDHRNLSSPINRNAIGRYYLINKIDSLSLFADTKTKSYQDLAGLDYKKTFSQYFNVKASFEIGQYDINNQENITVARIEEQSKFANPWSRNIKFQNYYLENESKFGDLKLTAGLFYKTSESLTEYIKNVGSPTNTNNSFTYLENIFSTFVNSNIVKGKTDITLGLNLEKTAIDGLNNSDSKKVDFYSLLPSLSINHQISETKSLNISYNRGINRPEYEWLNQQELFRNPYNKHVGGGVLLPTIYNKVSLTSTFASGLTLSGIYSNQTNRYSFFPFITNSNTINYSAINISNFYYLYGSVSFQKYLSKIWYFSTDLSGYYSNLKSKDYGIKNSGYTQQFSVSNYLTFKKIGQFGLTSTYNTTDFADAYKFLPQFSLNIEYSKSIFRKNGTVNLSFSDLTNSLKDRYVYQLNSFSVRDNYKFETRLLKLSVNYKLGNKSVKATSPRNPKSETEIERLK
ncbi:MAG: outer membrane beta-barrel family protein [Bacteroidota bacterium]